MRQPSSPTANEKLPMARVSHSVLHPDFIAEQVAARYALPGPVKGFLLYRGINDVYLVAAGDRKYAPRVWWRGGREIDMGAVRSRSAAARCASATSTGSAATSAPRRARSGCSEPRVRARCPPRRARR